MENKDDAKFLKLILFVSTGAYQSMGIIENPITKKSELNLDVTKQMIEFLDTIKEKTANNLSDNELDMLNQTIYDIKVNYMKLERERKDKNESKKESKEKDGDSKESKNPKMKKRRNK